MADIELAIKMDYQTYNNFVSNRYSRADVIAIHAALINGTPLPKGHGRIIDEDQIPGDNGWDFSDRLMSTPTIIEADESEEPNE